MVASLLSNSRRTSQLVIALKLCPAISPLLLPRALSTLSLMAAHVGRRLTGMAGDCWLGLYPTRSDQLSNGGDSPGVVGHNSHADFRANKKRDKEIL